MSISLEQNSVWEDRLIFGRAGDLEDDSRPEADEYVSIEANGPD